MGYINLWTLRRLKKLGASRKQLLPVYFRQVRAALEHAAPLWSNRITKLESRNIERVQRQAISLIFGNKPHLYKNTLKANNIETLAARRKRLTLNFARRAIKHENFKTWFILQKNSTMSSPQLKTTISYKKKLRKSPIAYINKLINSYNSGK